MAAQTLDPPPRRWCARTSWDECRRLLPGHSWLGQAGWKAVGRGDIWVVVADVLAWKIRRVRGKPQSYDLVRVDQLASLATHSGVHVPVADLARYRSASGGEIVGVAAGTLLRVADFKGYFDYGCAWPMACEELELTLPGGTVQLALETYGVMADSRVADSPWSDTVGWGDIRNAAVIVPADHPFARDATLVTAALKRIEAACHASRGPA